MNIDKCWYKKKCTNNCNPACVRYNLMHSLFEQSNIPESLWEYKDLTCDKEDFEAFKSLSTISKNMVDFVSNGNNIYIYSSTCGNGKTSWSIRLIYEYFNAIWHRSSFDCKAVFINVPNFLYNCKRSISQEIKGFDELCDKIENVDLVVWDDITCNTAYEHQILLQYIDGRINAGKSNIFTGNQDRQGCNNVLGERLTSRIFGCSQIIKFIEADKRGI